MARRKQSKGTEQTAPPADGGEWNADAGGVAVAEPAVDGGPVAPQPAIERPAWIDGPPTPQEGYTTDPAASVAGSEPPVDSHATSTARDTPIAEMPPEEDRPRTWAEPYKPLFASPRFGFEMGENRRFKQRVFRFAERPEQSVIDTLKEHGFTYRPAEKAWTIPANPDTRRLSEELVQQFAGEKPGRSL